MLAKLHGQLQHSAVKHRQRMYYHNCDCSENAGQHDTFDDFSRSIVSMIRSDVLNRHQCLDTAWDELMVFSHAVIGGIQLRYLFSSHNLQEMIFPSQVSGVVDDFLGDIIEVHPLGILFGTVVGLGAVHWAIRWICQLVLPLQLQRSISLPVTLQYGFLLIFSMVSWEAVIDSSARAELMQGGGCADFMP